MHRPHPDLHEYGLADDCPGCSELAHAPVKNGDRQVIRTLVAKAHARAAGGVDFARTENQLTAEARMLDVLTAFGQVATDAPAELEAYLRDRWRIQCRIEGRS